MKANDRRAKGDGRRQLPDRSNESDAHPGVLSGSGIRNGGGDGVSFGRKSPPIAAPDTPLKAPVYADWPTTPPPGATAAASPSISAQPGFDAAGALTMRRQGVGPLAVFFPDRPGEVGGSLPDDHAGLQNDNK